jgi:hypothetical protein
MTGSRKFVRSAGEGLLFAALLLHASAAVAQSSPREVLEKHGMLGNWAVDCASPPSAGNPYSVYRAIDAQRVQRDVMTGPSQRAVAGFIESAGEAGPNNLVLTQVRETREDVTVRVTGNRMRTMDFARNGVKLVAGGRSVGSGGGGGAETPWTNKCQAASPAAGASAPGSARAVLEKHGVLGTWAPNCSNPAARDNGYAVIRALDDSRVQFDVMLHPQERDEAYIVESAAEAGATDVSFTRIARARDEFRLQIEGQRVRLLDYTRAAGQTKIIEAGRFTENAGNPAVVGKETPWSNKCQ